MLVAHSWGENVVRNFLAWVERGEPGWTEAHVAVYFNIAGSVLGVPKVPHPLSLSRACHKRA